MKRFSCLPAFCLENCSVVEVSSSLCSVTLGYNLWEPFEEQKHGPWDELPRNRTHKDPAGDPWVGPRYFSTMLSCVERVFHIHNFT
jgi:hypothetical protein